MPTRSLIYQFNRGVTYDHTRQSSQPTPGSQNHPYHQTSLSDPVLPGVILAAGALHSPRLLQDYLETSALAGRLPCYRMVGRNHDQARSRAYRWNEDGMGGICDEQQRLCLAIALWNGRDPILKERAFGLTGNQGNHGEDVKEYYFYLDATPSHSYLRYLYKYPQAEYPYAWLVEENRRRGRLDPPFNLPDTGVFSDNRYWDVEVRYAKAGPEEIHIQVIAANRGPEAASLHLLPQLWFRNTCRQTSARTLRPQRDDLLCPPGRDRCLLPGTAARGQCRRRPHPPPGPGGDDLVQAVFPLRRGPLAGRRPAAAPP